MRQAHTPLACLPCDLETRSQQSLLTERSQFVQLLEAKGLLPLGSLQQNPILVQIRSQ